MPKSAWLEKYEYFINCIWNCICHFIERHGGTINDYVGMRYRLEMYLYKTCINKYYSYILLK
jgi:hypothetical protein